MNRCESCRNVLRVLARQVDASVALEAIRSSLEAHPRVDKGSIDCQIDFQMSYNKYFVILFRFLKVPETAANGEKELVQGSVTQTAYPDNYGNIWFLVRNDSQSIGYLWPRRLLRAIVSGHGRRRELSPLNDWAPVLIRDVDAFCELRERLSQGSIIDSSSIAMRYVGSLHTDHDWTIEIRFNRARTDVVESVIALVTTLSRGYNKAGLVGQSFVLTLVPGDKETFAQSALSSSLTTIASWIERGIPYHLNYRRFLDPLDFTVCWLGDGCRHGYQGPPHKQTFYLRYFVEIKNDS